MLVVIINTILLLLLFDISETQFLHLKSSFFLVGVGIQLENIWSSLAKHAM